MMLVTNGTVNFPFHRMSHLVRLLDQMQTQEKIIYQCGATSATKDLFSGQVTVRPFLDFNTFDGYLKKADVIICQGGPAAIYQANSYGKVPLVLPREKKYGEHVNDHQVYFAKLLTKKGLIKLLPPNFNLGFLKNAARAKLPKLNNADKLKTLINYLEGYINAK